MRVRHLPSVIIVLLCSAAAGCGSRVERPTTGMYRAVLALPGGDAPFGLEIAEQSGAYVLYLHNGNERTPVPEVALHEGTLTATFPGEESSLEATMHRRELKGAVTFTKAGGEEQVIPFEAHLGETHRFFEEPATDNADIAGRWEITFTDDEGDASQAVGEFEQRHDRVEGTVMTPSGDHRFLEGQVYVDEVQLSAFAGDAVHLYRLAVNEAGELTGDYWQGLTSHEHVHAVRNEDAELAEELPTTTMRSEHDNRVQSITQVKPRTESSREAAKLAKED